MSQQVTIQELATKTGKGVSTLMKYKKEGVFASVAKAAYGVCLYDLAEVTAALSVAKTEAPSGQVVERKPRKAKAVAAPSISLEEASKTARAAAVLAFTGVLVEAADRASENGEPGLACSILKAGLEFQNDFVEAIRSEAV
jgi:hypothetical protein